MVKVVADISNHDRSFPRLERVSVDLKANINSI